MTVDSGVTKVDDYAHRFRSTLVDNIDPVTVGRRDKCSRLPVGRAQLSRIPQFLPNVCSIGPTGDIADGTPDPAPVAGQRTVEGSVFNRGTPAAVRTV